MTATTMITRRRDSAESGRRARGLYGIRGFTLLELLIVLAVIALAASALGAALHRALPGARTTAVTHDAARTLRAARMQARTSGQPVWIIVGPDGRLTSLSHAPPPMDAPEPKDSGGPELMFTDWAGRPVRGLVIYPDGSSSGGRLQVRHRHHERRIELSELSGRTRFER